MYSCLNSLNLFLTHELFHIEQNNDLIIYFTESGNVLVLFPTLLKASWPPEGFTSVILAFTGPGEVGEMGTDRELQALSGVVDGGVSAETGEANRGDGEFHRPGCLGGGSW
jgi:hypothetical protein